MVDPRSYCLVISRTGSRIVPSKDRIDTLVAAYLKAIKTKQPAREEGRQLYDVLLRPIAEAAHKKFGTGSRTTRHRSARPSWERPSRSTSPIAPSSVPWRAAAIPSATSSTVQKGIWLPATKTPTPTRLGSAPSRSRDPAGTPAASTMRTSSTAW